MADASSARRRLLVAVLVGATCYLAFAVGDSLVSVPLRDVSASWACSICELFGLEVSRSGTVLATSTLSFDVEQRCSGSVVLRASFSLCVVLVLLARGGTMARLGLMAIAFGLALFCNAIRIATLVAVGQARGEHLVGFGHELIGWASTLLCLGVVYFLTDRIGDRFGSRREPSVRFNTATLGVALAMFALPSLLWVGRGWLQSPLDQYGPIWCVLGGLGILFAWRRFGRSGDGERMARYLFLAGLALGVLSAAVGINVMRAAAVVGIFVAWYVHHRGITSALRTIPCFSLLLFSLPTVRFQLGDAIYWPAGIAFICFGGWLLAKNEPSKVNLPEGLWGERWRAIATVCALALAWLYSISPGAQTPSALPGFGSEWAESELPVEERLRELFGDGGIVYKQFASPEHAVHILCTASGGDRHLVHPPEYCLRGAGWSIQSGRSVSVKGGQKTTHLTMTNGDQQLEFYYWFEGSGADYTDYRAVLRRDAWSRLCGERIDWKICRVIAPSTEAADAFFHSLKDPPRNSRGVSIKKMATSKISL